MRIDTFLGQSLLFEVNRASRSLDRHISRIFQTADLSFLEALVLVTVFLEDPRTVKPSELAATLSTTRGNISHCISSLEARGMVRRRIDPDDARSFDLRLRTQGKKQAMQVIRSLDRMQKEFENRVGAAQLAGALNVVKQVEQICANTSAAAGAAL